jgi:hypothetical protein
LISFPDDLLYFNGNIHVLIVHYEHEQVHNVN